jgi:hypothetical protein
LFFGKGLGDLPESLKYLRPLAVTGTFGYEIPDNGSRTSVVVDSTTGVRSLDIDHFANTFVMNLAVQYSFRYLQGNVEYVGLPSFITRLTPLVEFAFTKPMVRAFGEESTLIVAPGLVYSYLGVDLAAEALIPATPASGTHLGFILSAHIPLSIICPTICGRPLFGE